MFAHHIEAQFLHAAYIKNKRIVGRGGVKPVRPVSLIQHAMKEIGLMVQAEPHYAFFVRLYGEASHGKIAFHGILSILYMHLVEEGGFRRPRTQFG